MAKENFRAACLLQMLFSPLFLAAGRQPTGISSGVRCLNNYGFQRRRVACTWHWNQTTGEGPFYLIFSDTAKNRQSDLLCWLLPSNVTRDEFGCSAEGSGEFGENDRYKVYFHDASSGERGLSAAWETYEPMRNIKCDPPYGLRSNASGSKCLVEWKMPKAYEIIWSAMQWQLQFRATHIPWEQVENKTVVTRETWMEIDGAEFMPGASYVARVRCKTPDSDDAYVSQWSEWSPATEWSVPPGPLQREEPLVLLATLLSVPLSLGALLSLLLLCSVHSRVKSRCSAKTPSPAAFFLPLYATHRGNFQAWIGVKEQDAWLEGGKGTLEAISQLSSSKRLPAMELPPEERICQMVVDAPDRQDKASDDVIAQGEAEALTLPGRAPFPLEGLSTASEGFPYLAYENALFVQEEPQETETHSSCNKASCSQGTSTFSMAPVEWILEERSNRAERGS